MTDTPSQPTDQEKVVPRRKPQQARALFKIELILEATMRLLQQGDAHSITTNAIAETAGVSIGTVYQYFDDKQAILDTLSSREIEKLWGRVLTAVRSPATGQTTDRVRAIFRAFANVISGPSSAHRQLLEYAYSRGQGTRLYPLYEMIIAALMADDFRVSEQACRRLDRNEAFILTHSIAGIMRGLIISNHGLPAVHEVEEALSGLVAGFFLRPVTAVCDVSSEECQCTQSCAWHAANAGS